MDVRCPTDSTVQALLTDPIVVAWGDEDWDWMSAFELGAQELSSIRGHAVVLEQIATAANDINALVNGELNSAGKGIP